MYLHLGNDTVIKQEDVIGIFDLENSSISRHTRNFLRKAEQKKKVFTVSYELPKSFIVCNKKKSKNEKIYISQISTTTLLKRIGFVENLV